MEISRLGLELIGRFEGFKPEPYQCQAGVWTIGYGHTKRVSARGVILYPDETSDKHIARINKDQGHILLREDLDETEQYVNNLINGNTRLGVEIPACDPSQPLYDAFISFAFNCGGYALAKSSLWREWCNATKRKEYQLGTWGLTKWLPLFADYCKYTDKHGFKQNSRGLLLRRLQEALHAAGGGTDQPSVLLKTAKMCDVDVKWAEQ